MALATGTWHDLFNDLRKLQASPSENFRRNYAAKASYSDVGGRKPLSSRATLVRLRLIHTSGTSELQLWDDAADEESPTIHTAGPTRLFSIDDGARRLGYKNGDKITVIVFQS